jgi:hypothetical protein
LCREHGLQLKQLAESESQLFQGFGMFGIIKETGVVRTYACLRIRVKDMLLWHFHSHLPHSLTPPPPIFRLLHYSCMNVCACVFGFVWFHVHNFTFLETIISKKG